MLTPSKLDPNYKAEIERRKKDPASFGMGPPVVEPNRIMTGTGLSADKPKPELKK